MKVARFTKTNYEYRNLDDRPFPDYDVFGGQKMVDDFSMATRVLYRYPRPYPRTIPIVTARACPFNCSFCIHSGGPRYRARSVENIMQEIGELHEKYKFNILIINDELFAANKKRMREFCEGILKGKEEYDWDFDWLFQTHANARLDKETLVLAKRAGCYCFSYGIESASPRVLESMNKKIKISQIIEGIKLAEDARVGFAGNLIFGDFAETGDTILETLTFYFKYSPSAHIFLAMLMAYPGSKIFDTCMARGIIADKAEYYKTVGKQAYKMMDITPAEYYLLIRFIETLEHLWLLPQAVEATLIEEDSLSDDPVLVTSGTTMFKVWAICPHCNKEIMYRANWRRELAGSPRLFLGVGCTKCNRKIRINIKNG